MQAEESHTAINSCVASEKQSIVNKQLFVKHSFLTKKITSNWSDFQEIAKRCGIQSIELVTEPYHAINIEGTEPAVKQAESEILSFFDNNTAHFTLQLDNTITRLVLKSPEMLQLCKELHDELGVVLKIQMQPRILSSALNESGVVIQICEGDIALESCNTFINFTDKNFTLSDEVRALLDQAEIKRYEDQLKQHPIQPSKRAFSFGEYNNKIIIHAIIPDWVDGNSSESSAITSALMESLLVAKNYKATSISLPFFSCVDDHLPLDLLTESCLSGVHKFLRYSNQIRRIRLVLSVNMAEKFKEKFTSGVFKQCIIPDDLDIADTHRFCNLGTKAWMWKGDDGYNFYKPTDNQMLCRKSGNAPKAVASKCWLKIGRYDYIVDFQTMTQTNARTMKKRNVKCLPLTFVWQYRSRRGKWEQFSPQLSLMIEAMYATRTERLANHLKIQDQTHNFDFQHMVKLNIDTDRETDIRRINSVVTFYDFCTEKSKISIVGLPEDICGVEERLLQCAKSFMTVQFYDAQKKFLPIIVKYMQQIQRKNDVKIFKTQETGPTVRYEVKGHKESVQKAVIEMYQVTMTHSSAIQGPLEWEPQSESIVLLEIFRGSPEWSKICCRMQMTLDCNIVSVKRIQNKFLWKKYLQHKELMSRKGGNSTTEFELFHGTTNNLPKRIYESEEGFDMRYSRQGLWGLGNYFAVAANYASNYAYKDASGIFQLFLAIVLVGDSRQVNADQALRMPPFKPDGTVRYDTVTGVSNGARIYVTYSNDKAYPLYLISYTKTVNPK